MIYALQAPIIEYTANILVAKIYTTQEQALCTLAAANGNMHQEVPSFLEYISNVKDTVLMSS